MRGDNARVLIVCAAVAGFAAARTLHDWGASVEVVDRMPAAPREGTGQLTLGNAMRALDKLGCGEAVTEPAVRILRQRTAGHRDLPTSDVGRPGPAVADTHRASGPRSAGLPAETPALLPLRVAPSRPWHRLGGSRWRQRWRNRMPRLSGTAAALVQRCRSLSDRQAVVLSVERVSRDGCHAL